MNINFFEDSDYEDTLFFTIDEFDENILFSADYNDIFILYDHIISNDKDYTDSIYSFKFMIDCTEYENKIPFYKIFIVVDENDSIKLEIGIFNFPSDDTLLELSEELSNELINKLIEYYLKNIESEYSYE